MKLPTAIYVAGSFWLFASVGREFNKVYIENASPGLKMFNLVMLGFTGKLLYDSIIFSQYLSIYQCNS